MIPWLSSDMSRAPRVVAATILVATATAMGTALAAGLTSREMT